MSPSSIYARVVALALVGAIITSPTQATNVLVTSTPVLQGTASIGVAINAASMGRACGKIGGVAVAQAPAGACGPLNGPIPPARTITFTDAAGNSVSAQSRQTFALFGLKSYFVNAKSTSVNAATFAQAEFVDPLTFSSSLGEGFMVELSPTFEDEEGNPGLELSGSGEGGTGQFTETMSSSITGPLFSLTLDFAFGQPLGIDLTIGQYLTGKPGWDEATLENELSTALGADSPSNDFILHQFEFPGISIAVPAGATLSVFTDDTATANVPEPASLAIFGSSLALLAALRWHARPRPL